MNQTIFYSVSISTIVIYIVALIVALDCVWRVKSHFNAFLKILTTGIAVVLIRLVFSVTGLIGKYPDFIMSVFDFVTGIILLIAFVAMFRMIKDYNREKV